MRPPSKLLAAVAGAALLYVLALRAYYVGFFNDDAFYIIGARSLCLGRYAELNAPGHPPLVNYFPGYSIMLAPMAALKPSSLLAYQALSILLVVLTLCFLWRWLRGNGASERVATSAILLSAFNPLTLSHSGVVLSEIPLALFLLLSLLAMRHAWNRSTPIGWSIAFALTGFCAILRPEAVFLPLAAAAMIARERRWRLALLGLLPLLGFAAFCLRNRLLEGTWLVYGLEAVDPYRTAPLKEALSHAWEGARYYTDLIFAGTFFRAPFAAPGLLSSAVAVTGALGAAFGAYRTKKGGVEGVLELYLAAIFIVFLLWGKKAGRYLLPVLPYLAGYFFTGIEALSSDPAVKRRLVAGACALSLTCCAFPDWRIVHASLFETTPLTAPPRAAYAWVKTHASVSDLFATEWDGRFYLKTGREVLHLPRPSSPQELARWLSDHGVRYVFVESAVYAMKPANPRAFNAPWSSGVLRAILEKTGRSRLAFEDPTSGSAIYRVN